MRADTMTSLFLLPAALAFLLLAAAACRWSGSGGEAEIAEGRRLYLAYGCGACHGREGDGNGPASLSLQKKPRDFRRPESFRKERSVDSIAQTIAEGAGAVMPAAPFIKLEDRQRIARYVLSLAPAPSGSSKGE